MTHCSAVKIKGRQLSAQGSQEEELIDVLIDTIVNYCHKL